MLRRWFLMMAWVTVAGTCGATTYLVRPDGTGDFPNIQAALAGSVDGDQIDLASGTFRGDGNHDIDFLGRAVTVRSQSGNPTACMIDLGGNAGFFFHQGEGPESHLEGVLVVNGSRHDGGGAILLLSASPTVTNCVFAYNEGYSGGGGILCYAGSNPTISGCRFTNCLSTNGGGLCCFDASSPVVIDCVFERNTGTYGGAIACFDGSAPTLNHCRLTDNRAWTDGGVLFAQRSAQPALNDCLLDANLSAQRGVVTSLESSSAALTRCTLAGNTGPAGLWIGTGAAITLDRTIVALEIDGSAVQCEGVDAPAFTCCDLSGNAGGDWGGCIADQLGTNGNFSADPLFCDPSSGDWSLHEDSPCAPNNPECGQVGALGVGCGPSPVEITSWGALKGRFRR